MQWEVGDRVVLVFLHSHLTGQVNADHPATWPGKPLDGCLATCRVFPCTGVIRDLNGLILPVPFYPLVDDVVCAEGLGLLQLPIREGGNDQLITLVIRLLLLTHQ